MAFSVLAEERVMNDFHNFFKNLSAVSREVENYSQSEQEKRKSDTKKGKGDGYQCKNHRDESADGATANFPFTDFRIFYMVGVKHVSAHPVERKPN